MKQIYTDRQTYRPTLFAFTVNQSISQRSLKYVERITNNILFSENSPLAFKFVQHFSENGLHFLYYTSWKTLGNMTSSLVEFGGMSRWANRKALVTGCSSGIGAVIAKDLVRYGVIVIGCARNVEKIDVLIKECEEAGYKGKLIPYKCDVGKSSEVEAMFEWLEKQHGGVDICVNNAGAGSMTPLLDLKGDEMSEILNINVVGLVLCSNLAVKSMLARNIDDGHIINISSMLGHIIIGIMNFYTATKHAVTALTKGLRMELAAKGSRIKVTQISPGRVETNFHPSIFGDAEKGRKFYESVESLTPRDVSDAVLHAISAPDNCQIYDIMLQPTNLGSPAAYATILKP
ncbi:unnamed protein product [Orchesella dallaii]|uniref:Dehydrogenase/reductase SDR family member 11 n=1 Tax=Orchesella dallaii TaxID=48710 RepID=A0ABP1QMP5_9HEXA